MRQNDDIMHNFTIFATIISPLRRIVSCYVIPFLYVDHIIRGSDKRAQSKWNICEPHEPTPAQYSVDSSRLALEAVRQFLEYR